MCGQGSVTACTLPANQLTTHIDRAMQMGCTLLEQHMSGWAVYVPPRTETISGPQCACLMLGLGVLQLSYVNTFLWLPIYLLHESLSYVDVICDYRWLLIMLPWFHLDKYLIGKHIDYMKIVAKLYLLDKLDTKFECEYLDLYMSHLSYLRLRYRILVKFDFSP